MGDMQTPSLTNPPVNTSFFKNVSGNTLNIGVPVFRVIGSAGDGLKAGLAAAESLYAFAGVVVQKNVENLDPGIVRSKGIARCRVNGAITYGDPLTGSATHDYLVKANLSGGTAGNPVDPILAVSNFAQTGGTGTGNVLVKETC